MDFRYFESLLRSFVVPQVSFFSILGSGGRFGASFGPDLALRAKKCENGPKFDQIWAQTGSLFEPLVALGALRGGPGEALGGRPGEAWGKTTGEDDRRKGNDKKRSRRQEQRKEWRERPGIRKREDKGDAGGSRGALRSPSSFYC